VLYIKYHIQDLVNAGSFMLKTLIFGIVSYFGIALFVLKQVWMTM